MFASSLVWSFPHKYDRHFKASASLYLPGVNWKLLKAQCYQESLLKFDAISPVGAQGLCQFMPATWKEVAGQLKYSKTDSAFNPVLSIKAAGYYMARLRRGWSAPRPNEDRHNLAMASYNAGFGSLLAAQRLCGNPALYDDVIKCLPNVTGRHSEETIVYVNRIRGFYLRMMAGE